MRLIDADALMDGIVTWQKDLEKEYGWHDAYVQCLDGVIHSIENAPTIDAVNVVRCKDCARWQKNSENKYSSCITEPDWFCADGERRES